MKNNSHLYKRVGISISLLVFVFSSISSDLSQKPKDVVLKFNSTFNSRSLEELKETLSPTLTVINEEGEIVAKNREDYFENITVR